MTDSQLPPPTPPASDPVTGAAASTSSAAGSVKFETTRAEGTAVAAPDKPETQKNLVGLIAFIIAVVGFLFACIPGALLIGWILLPTAFILAIVGLVLPRRRRAFALIALILAVVGTIVGVIVFFAVVASSFDDAFGDLDSSVAPPAASEEADETSSPAEEADPAEEGTRENPAVVGSTITGSEYTVAINSVDLDATDQVLGANEFNEAPPADTAYALINATITFTGSESGYAAFVGIDYVASSGEVVTSSDSFAVGPEPTLGLEELYNGGVASGNVVLTVPAGDVGTVRVRPGLLDDEVFVAVQ